MAVFSLTQRNLPWSIFTYLFGKKFGHFFNRNKAKKGGLTEQQNPQVFHFAVKPQEKVGEKGTKTIENIKKLKTDHGLLCSAWEAEINCSGKLAHPIGEGCENGTVVKSVRGCIGGRESCKRGRGRCKLIIILFVINKYALKRGFTFRTDGVIVTNYCIIFLYIFWRARLCWPLLCIIERFLDSNAERGRSKRARYQLSHPSPSLATHLPA
jgi:hypothetical protein